MLNASDRIRIYKPKGITELLIMYQSLPDAFIYAGGTDIMRRNIPAGASAIICLDDISELSGIARTERYLEFGAMVKLVKLLSIGTIVVPKALHDAIKSTATVSIRNMATIGGAICRASSYSDVLPPLYAMDARLELRKQNAARWIPVTSFVRENGDTVMEKGELLTRVRIYYSDWNRHFFRKVGRKMSQNPCIVNFCGIANVTKDSIHDFRISIGGIGPTIFRSLDLESKFIGIALPPGQKHIEQFSNELNKLIVSNMDNLYITEYKRSTVLNLGRMFLQNLGIPMDQTDPNISRYKVR